MLRDDAAAVDAMHDVFVEVLRRRESLVDAGVCSYLWRAATNVCLNRLRSKKRAALDDDDAVLLEIASGDDVEKQTVAGDLLARVLGREPESTRVIATMFYVDKMTLEEVAAASSMSVSGVRKRLRGLKLRALTLKDAA